MYTCIAVAHNSHGIWIYERSNPSIIIKLKSDFNLPSNHKVSYLLSYLPTYLLIGYISNLPTYLWYEPTYVLGSKTLNPKPRYCEVEVGGLNMILMTM